MSRWRTIAGGSTNSRTHRASIGGRSRLLQGSTTTERVIDRLYAPTSQVLKSIGAPSPGTSKHPIAPFVIDRFVGFA